MTVTELREALVKMETDGMGPLEVWSIHPEWAVQWGPIASVAAPCITSGFQPVALIDTRVSEEG